jgi:uncharacterized protein YndB with AHSA1/START domain
MSTQAANTTAVRTSIVVDAAPERAFTVFTAEMSTWWPPEHHLLEVELSETVFEPRVGGRIYDKGVDGSECTWARVLTYEPPDRVVFSWDIGLDWKIETEHARTSEVELRFVPDGPERTRVELEHRHLERHGEGWEAMRDAVGSPEGWGVGMRRFAAYVGGRPM